MKNILITILCLSATSATFAQDKGKFSFEFGSGIQYIAMCNLNQFYIDSLAKPQGLFKDNFKIAKSSFITVRYQPSNFFDVGFYGNYLRAELKGNPVFYSTDDIGNATTNQGKSQLLIQSMGYGLTVNIQFSQILKWYEKENKFLNRSRLLAEVRVGNSNSIATINIQFPTLPIANSYSRYNGNNIESQIAFKFEYDFLKDSMISSIGLKAGYNYSKTKTLKNQYSQDWKVLNGKKINLSSNGYFGTLYFVIGK